MKDNKILPFDYIKGDEFTEKLKEVTGCRTFLDMAELLDVPKATFSAWKLHDRTSHELMVRLHLALGIPIAELALNDTDKQKFLSAEHIRPYKAKYSQNKTIPLTRDDYTFSANEINSYCLTNGELIETGSIPYSIRIFNSWNIDAHSCIEIETNEGRFIVDESSTNAVSGKYLIDIDGNLSINHIQRLPGKKLAVVFGDSTVEVGEEDIKVIGRVAVTLKKD